MLRRVGIECGMDAHSIDARHSDRAPHSGLGGSALGRRVCRAPAAVGRRQSMSCGCALHTSAARHGRRGPVGHRPRSVFLGRLRGCFGSVPLVLRVKMCVCGFPGASWRRIRSVVVQGAMRSLSFGKERRSLSFGFHVAFACLSPFGKHMRPRFGHVLQSSVFYLPQSGRQDPELSRVAAMRSSVKSWCARFARV